MLAYPCYLGVMSVRSNPSVTTVEWVSTFCVALPCNLSKMSCEALSAILACCGSSFSALLFCIISTAVISANSPYLSRYLRMFGWLRFSEAISEAVCLVLVLYVWVAISVALAFGLAISLSAKAFCLRVSPCLPFLWFIPIIIALVGWIDNNCYLWYNEAMVHQHYIYRKPDGNVDRLKTALYIVRRRLELR